MEEKAGYKIITRHEFISHEASKFHGPTKINNLIKDGMI
jgi:hypothetical protein